ncbi:YolD-like family protein [Brevibacillus centrosporus]|uniref:YolD-like family protein n=1 Tax=Brevibacillus centrosporus TaxID=54910 RepID=UPI003B02CB9B
MAAIRAGQHDSAGGVGTKGDGIMASKIENPFSIRFVLPEQRELYLQVKEDEKLTIKPVVEEDEFGEMNFRIYDSIQYDYAITVQWFKKVKSELGIIETVWGVVKEIDAVNMRFKLINDEEVWWIRVEDVVAVSK